jgi:hypothetical protein
MIALVRLPIYGFPPGHNFCRTKAMAKPLPLCKSHLAHGSHVLSADPPFFMDLRRKWIYVRNQFALPSLLVSVRRHGLFRGTALLFAVLAWSFSETKAPDFPFDSLPLRKYIL